MSPLDSYGCRPTLRVLRECLSNPDDWDDPEQCRSIARGDFKSVIPLSSLRHPVVIAGKSLTTNEDSGANLTIFKHSVRARLQSIWKEIRAEQWRGLVTQPEPKSRWWLLHAGLKRTGDRSNVYDQVERLDDAAIKSLYPVQDDRDLLALEISALANRRWRMACLTTLIDAIAGAAGSSETQHPAQLPPPPNRTDSPLNIEIELIRLNYDEDPAFETPVEVLLSLRLIDWNDDAIRQSIVPELVGFMDPQKERWSVHTVQDKVTVYSVEITEARLSQLMAAAELGVTKRTSLTGAINAPINNSAHYVAKDTLVEAYVVGIEVKALCGQWFVPTQDHTKKPVCSSCKTEFAGTPSA